MVQEERMSQPFQSRIAVLLLASLVASACADVPLAGVKRDNAAKRFRRPPIDQANIYVYEAGNGRAELYLDGAYVTTIDSYTFMLLPVRPGHHTLASRLRGKLHRDPNEKDAEIEFYVGGGLNHFVEQEVMVYPTRLPMVEVSLERVGAEDGKESVMKCTLVKDRPPPLPPAPSPEVTSIP
jgi:hypothetical protein